MDRSLYPDDWDQIAFRIKQEVNWQCEQCQKVCRRSGESLADFILRYFEGNIRDNDYSEITNHPQRWTLTVAHLDHTPSNCARANLKALCAPCHCRMDLKAMGQKRHLKRERLGQINLFNSGVKQDQ